ncbi:succinate dehydrogenase, cytochrome b556 subunit [Blochmannia endosymbiont of Polyrhachis (Hedomyrma) turneri]|uniref:succinate dehydrogenase, cytochrome b556 subunit n=1 Tax=Blochmannia endosymbiont of Polyrhachis (Hedomyrma) turneri TaxID=1505596 RepID=UPI00061A63E8|nr:succinate dehydrogenase, cytochrome b556 subunit [Blochmannia endosymbiont of Polyrhachis (Hedomyrma) turneri]AKC59896.1 Succinate dehydrogenase cytochrome b556 subunit [Blochmannia endosymbiont of Polyrhachis (Hedomyrma) turneri]
MIKKYKPIIDLNLKNIKFPLTAIASISHRISGAIMFAIVGLLLLILKLSLISTENFYQIKLMINNYFIKFLIWNMLIFFIYHFINGVRHIIVDCGYLNKKITIATKSAQIVFLLTIIVSILIGLLLCEIF